MSKTINKKASSKRIRFKVDSDKEKNGFESLTVKVSNPVTATLLLTSDDNEVVLTAIISLDCYIKKNKNNARKFARDNKLVPILMSLLKSPIPVRRLSLKLLTKIDSYDDMCTYLKENKTCVGKFFDMYLTTTDNIIKEYITYLLYHLFMIEEFANEFLPDVLVIEALLADIIKTKDMDIKENCLEFLRHLFNHPSAISFAKQTKTFRMDLFRSLLMKAPKRIQLIVTEILKVITNWDIPELITQINRCKLVPCLYNILKKPEWSSLHNSTLDIMYSCIRYSPCQVDNVETKEFLYFVKYCTTASSSHALACVSIITEFAKDVETRQALYDLSVEEDLVRFFEVDCDLLKTKICYALSEMCRHRYCAKKVFTTELQREIIKILEKKPLPWYPYKQSVIKLVNILVKSFPDIKSKLCKNSILKLLKSALDQKKYIDKYHYILLMDLFNDMFQNMTSACCNILRKINQKFLELLDEDNEEIVRKSLEVLLSNMHVEKYRGWFLNHNGPHKIVDMIWKENTFYKELLSFIHFSTKFRYIATAFVRAGLVPMLEMLTDNKLMINQITNNLFEYEPVIKFHRMNFLNVTDTTDDNFFVYISTNFKDISLDNLEIPTEISTTSYVLLANFSGKKRLRLQMKPTVRFADDETPKSSKSNVLVYRLKMPSCADNPDAENDYYLRKYLKKLKLLLENVPTMEEKIDILAKFVNYRLSGHDGENISFRHNYETHLAELKMKFNSNKIPLGHIRIGKMIERAVLFKTLADRVNIPSTLTRIKPHLAWNEVPVFSYQQDTENIDKMTLHVVDLMYDVGSLETKSNWFNKVSSHEPDLITNDVLKSINN